MLNPHLKPYLRRLAYSSALLVLLSLAFVGSVVASKSSATGVPSGGDPTRPTQPDSCDMDWKTIPATNLGNGRGTVNDIAILSDSDIWTVGDFAAGTLGRSSGHIMHWNGNIW